MTNEEYLAQLKEEAERLKKENMKLKVELESVTNSLSVEQYLKNLAEGRLENEKFMQRLKKVDEYRKERDKKS